MPYDRPLRSSAPDVPVPPVPHTPSPPDVDPEQIAGEAATAKLRKKKVDGAEVLPPGGRQSTRLVGGNGAVPGEKIGARLRNQGRRNAEKEWK